MARRDRADPLTRREKGRLNGSVSGSAAGPVDNRRPRHRGRNHVDVRAEDVTDLDWYLDNVVVPSDIERRAVGPVRAWQGSWAALAHRLGVEADESPVGDAVRLALTQGFVLGRAQVRGSGVTDATLRRTIRHGDWTSCGHGSVAVVSRSDLDRVGEEHDQRRREHALQCAAAVQRKPGHLIAVASAAVVHGLPVLTLPSLPELATVATTSGRRHASHVRIAELGPDEVTDWFGAPTITADRTVVDLARSDARSGLMAADAALHEGVVGSEGITRSLQRSAGLFGVRRARDVLALASHLIESPLESLTHLALHDSGFPPPELQRKIRGFDGKAYRVARVTWTDVLHQWPATSSWLRALMASTR
jgi:hypothetical protein